MSFAGPRELAAEDEGEVSVTIKNVSNRVYGTAAATQCSVQFTTDPRMPPKMAVSGTLKDPLSWELNIDALQPNETREFKLCVRMNALSDSAVKYFERVTWRVDLKLRGRLIQTANAQIRISPKWTDFQRTPYEAILFTGHHMSRDEWLLWKRILDGIAVNAALWDGKYSLDTCHTLTLEQWIITTEFRLTAKLVKSTASHGATSRAISRIVAA